MEIFLQCIIYLLLSFCIGIIIGVLLGLVKP